ncbi:MAG: hypothetical protein ACYDAG_18730 [Chloroflexota bacterium]
MNLEAAVDAEWRELPEFEAMLPKPSAAGYDVPPAIRARARLVLLAINTST